MFDITKEQWYMKQRAYEAYQWPLLVSLGLRGAFILTKSLNRTYGTILGKGWEKELPHHPSL